jgi:hypothetical protein
MEPEQTEVQAEALLATRRILARLKLDLLESGEDLASELTEEDRELLAHDTRSGAPKMTCGSSPSGTAL